MKKSTIGIALLVVAGFVSPAASQSYPDRPVDAIIPSAAGSGVDALARAFFEEMSKTLGQPFVTQNKPGAGNTIGTALVANANPDGYTLGFTAAGPFVTQVHLQDLSYSIDDFTFICQAFEVPVVLAVKEDSPLKTLDDAIAEAKAKPGSVAVGTAGMATIPHIGLAELGEQTGAEFKHTPYQGDPLALQALLNGEISLGGLALGAIIGQPVRALAFFSDSRFPAYPDVPTVKEAGYDIVKSGMAGLFAPAGLPADVKEKLTDACKQSVESEAFTTLAARLNQAAAYIPGTEWEERLHADSQSNKAVIERLGLKSN